MVNTFSVDFATAYAAARGPKFDVALAFIDGLHTYEGKLSICPMEPALPVCKVKLW